MLHRLNQLSNQTRVLPATRRQSRDWQPSLDGLEQRRLLSTVSVSGEANIYGAGLKVSPDPGGGGGGVLPVQVNLSSLGNPQILDFPTVSGTVSGYAAEGGYNGPDGGPYWGGVTDVPAYGGISGVRDSDATMFLVGVFLGSSGQPVTPPPTLNVTNANNIASFSPVIGQQFFIGNGLTSSQALQTFNVPVGATALFLGFAENLGFSNPDLLPGYYSDNGGSLSVEVESDPDLPTLTALSASTATAVTGQSVTFTATVSDLFPGGETPTGGTVTFSDQGGAIGSATLADGVAECTTSSLAAGAETITASYGGTADFAPSSTGTIVTAAGDGTAGYAGNDGPALAAELNYPYGLAIDAADDLFIADANNKVVREVVKATGDIITVAGNGIAGYKGDGGSATAAELNAPDGLAVDSAGDLFISDKNNNVIREVEEATGDIITVAGNGTAGYSGDGGPATDAELDSPRGITIDSAGDVFIADCLNNVIREVVKATGNIITVAGDGTAGYNGDGGPASVAELNTPYGVAIDSAGDLFIADDAENAIREVVRATGDITTIAGDGTAGYSGDGGTATAAELNGPNGVAVDPAGDVFIADTGTNVIREVVTATGQIITVAGDGKEGYSGDNGPATVAELDGPGRVVVDPAGEVFVADSNNSVVRELTPAVTVTVNGPVAVQVVITSAPLGLIAGMSGEFTVALEDANGDLGATSTKAQTINLSTNSSEGGFLSSGGSPITSITIPSGQTSATVYYGDYQAGTPTLTASDSAFTTPAATQVETIDPSETTHFVVTTDFSGTDVAGTVGSVTVTAEDVYGNIAGGGPDQYLGTVALGSTDSQLAGLPSTYTFTTADAGSHTFMDVRLETVGSQTITATDSVTSSITGTSQAIQVSAAKASSLAIVTRPPSGIAGGKIGHVVVHAVDPYGNLDQSYNGEVTISLATGSIGNLSGTLTMMATSGVATFDDVVDTVSGSITLAATGTTTGGGTISTGTSGGATIPIAPAAPDHLGVTTTFAGTDVAGMAGTVTVEVFDTYGNPVGSAYLGTVDLSSTDSKVSGLPSSYTFTAGDAGSHTFSDVVLETAGSQTITATDSVTGTITGTSAAVDVVPAAASQVVITSAPLTLVAGDPVPIAVQFEDAYDNLGAVSTADQTIGLGTTSAASAFYATSSGGAITSITIPAGQTSTGFDYEDTRAGTPMVSASDGALGATATQQETIVPAAASQVVITSGALDQAAGSLGPVTLEMADTYGNPGAVSTADQTIDLGTTGVDGAFYAGASGGNTITSVVIAASQSSATVYYGDTQTGTPTMTASDSAFSTAVATQQETINPAPAARFVVTTSFPSPDVAGTSGTVTVTAYDAYGNPVSSGPDQYLGTVELSSSDRRVSSLPASYTFSAADAGSHTYAGVVLVTAGSQTISATDSVTSTITGEATVDVVAGSAGQAVIAGSSLNLIAGDLGTLTVQLEDAYGNTGAVSAGTQTIGLASTSSAGTFSATPSGGPIGSVVIAAGQSTATVDYGDTQAGSPIVTATDAALGSSASSQQETVTPATATELVVTTSLSNPDVAGTVGTVTVTAKDRYGNTAGKGPDQYLGTVDLSSGDSRTTGLAASYTFTAADAGSHTFTGVMMETAGDRTITVTDSVNGTITGSTAVTVTSAAASQLVFTTPPPTTLTPGQTFTVVVAAEDPYGNVDTSFDGDVTITLPGQGGLTATEPAQDGVATFAGLTAGASAGGNPIQASGGGLAGGSTGPVTVSGGSGSSGNGSGSSGNGSGSNAPGNSTANTQVPTIIGEQVVLFRKKNKKGKAVGKPVVEGYKLIYSTAMDGATAGLSSNYELTATSTKHSKKKTIAAPTPVGLSAGYDPSTNTVTLMLQGKQTFAKGGQLTVIYAPPTGVSSASEVPLASSDATFTIQPKGTAITPG